MSDFRRIIREWGATDPELYPFDCGKKEEFLGVEIYQRPTGEGFIDYLDLSFGPRFNASIIHTLMEPPGYGYWYNREECIEYLGPLVRTRQKLALRR